MKKIALELFESPQRNWNVKIIIDKRKEFYLSGQFNSPRIALMAASEYCFNDKKLYCLSCEKIYYESELQEPYGLSGMAPACPYCHSDEFMEVEPIKLIGGEYNGTYQELMGVIIPEKIGTIFSDGSLHWYVYDLPSNTATLEEVKCEENDAEKEELTIDEIERALIEFTRSNRKEHTIGKFTLVRRK